MTYKLNPEVKKIVSPITVRFDGVDDVLVFANGIALAEANFEKNYLIESVSARDGTIEITIRENDMVNALNWVGEEAVSFF